MIAAWLGLATTADMAALSARLADVEARQQVLLQEVREAVDIALGVALAELKNAAAVLQAAGARTQPGHAAPAAGRVRHVRKKARPA